MTADGALDALCRDVRSLRPSIVDGGAEGLAERSWGGAFPRIGEAVVGLHSLRGRGIVATFDPDTLEHDPGVLRYTERLAEAGIERSVGSVGDAYDNALAETGNGLYKAEAIRSR